MESKNKGLKVFSLYTIFIIVLVALDQISKYAIVSKIELYNKITVIDKFFYLHYVQNTGSAFSFLADKSWGIYVLSVMSLLMAIFLYFLSYKSATIKQNFLGASLALVVAGAAGNLVDRFRLHYVVDFLRFDFGNYTFPIFNVADICAVVGSFLVIFIFIFQDKKVDALLESIGIKTKKDEKKEDKKSDS